MSTGRLEIILGPMFSGKTTELIRRTNRAKSVGKKVLCVNSQKDTRCAKEVQTHDATRLSALKVTDLSDILEYIEEYDIITIDEFQFFNNPIPIVENLLDQGKMVIISGLDGDFRQKRFGDILELVPQADRVDKLHALCYRCGGDAPFTKRIISDSVQELIGASESYKACCRKHL